MTINHIFTPTFFCLCTRIIASVNVSQNLSGLLTYHLSLMDNDETDSDIDNGYHTPILSGFIELLDANSERKHEFSALTIVLLEKLGYTTS